MELQTKATDHMSDEQIIELYWQRDEKAIIETDIKYKRFLLSIAQNIVQDMCDSEECLNDTSTVCLRSLKMKMIITNTPKFMKSHLY